MKKLPIGLGIVALVGILGFGLWVNYTLNEFFDEIDWENMPL